MAHVCVSRLTIGANLVITQCEIAGCKAFCDRGNKAQVFLNNSHVCYVLCVCVSYVFNYKYSPTLENILPYEEFLAVHLVAL